MNTPDAAVPTSTGTTMATSVLGRAASTQTRAGLMPGSCPTGRRLAHFGARRLVLALGNTVARRAALRPDPHMAKSQSHDRSGAEVIGARSAAYPCRTQATSSKNDIAHRGRSGAE